MISTACPPTEPGEIVIHFYQPAPPSPLPRRIPRPRQGVFADIKARWVKELRSGKWRQIQGVYLDTPAGSGRCALGVLYETLYGEIPTYLPASKVSATIGISVSEWSNLCDWTVNLNDTEGKTFAEIADLLEMKV